MNDLLQIIKRSVNILLLAGIMVCVHSSFGQRAVSLHDGEYDIEVSPQAYLFTGQATLKEIDKLLRADSSKLIPNDAPREISYGVQRPRGWCVFRIHNRSHQHNWILKLQQARIDTAQLYVVRDNEVIERFPMTGHFQTLPERSVHSLPFAFNITLKENETITCYIYTARQYGKHAVIPNIQTKDYFENYEYSFNVVMGFVSGMVALTSIVGFFLFLFVRQKLYLYYSIYTLSFFFVLLTDTGFAHAFLFFPHDQTVADGFTMNAYYWMGGCLGIFTIELLQLKQHGARWMYRFGIILSYSLCAIGFLLLVPGLPHAIRWTFVSYSYYLALITNLYILYIICVSMRKKDPIVYFYMAGFFITSVVAVLITLSDFHIVDVLPKNKDFYYLTPFFEILLVAFGIGVHFSTTLKERAKVQRALNETQDQIITIQENERRRIAQDLHDDVSNSLAAIRNMVIRLNEPAVVEKEIDHLIDTIRRISHDLMPVNVEEFSLPEVIEHTVSKFKDHPSLALEFSHTGKPVRLKPFHELVIYRIISELITNILKHAHATQALIQLIYQTGSLVVTVEDNGTGINNPKGEEGMGLRSIRLRADYLHATLKIESDTKGTLIILEVPYENR